MKIDQAVLSHINIRRITKYVLFNTCDILPEVETRASNGLRDIEKIVTSMMSMDMIPSILKLEDAAEEIGISAKDARRNIRRAIKIGQDFYDGTYGRPCDIDPDHAVYIVAALAISEYGRKMSDVSEYVAKHHLSDFLEIGAIRNCHDMGCYVLLTDYFETCLSFGKVSLTKCLNNNKGSLITNRKLMNYITEQSWYGSEDLTEAAIGLYASRPKLSEVTNAILAELEAIRSFELKKQEEYELNKAFDEQ